MTTRAAPPWLAPDELVVCHCDPPQPDAIGQCADCWRLVVTYAHSHPARVLFRRQYPELWKRATRLGLRP